MWTVSVVGWSYLGGVLVCVWGGVSIVLLLLSEANILVVALKCNYVMCLCMQYHTPTLMETLLWSAAMRMTRHRNVKCLFDFLLFLFNEFRERASWMCFCVHVCLCWWLVWCLGKEHEVGISSDTGASDICVCECFWRSGLREYLGLFQAERGLAGLKLRVCAFLLKWAQR